MQAVVKHIDWSKIPASVQPFSPEGQTFLTPGHLHHVYAVSVYKKLTFFLVIDDIDTPTFIPEWFFLLASPEVPANWICNVSLGEGLDLVLGPDFIAKDVDAYNGMVDQDRDAVSQLWKYVAVLGHSTPTH